ncbi:MAG: hypothetical protein AAFX99_14295, partial [Myxococcota bacterium]
AWLPKASQDGRPFDLRVVTIQNQACHVVVRTGTSPMTNLHLGNARGDRDALEAHLGHEAWQRLMATCVQAKGLFPHSLYAGVDLLVTRGAPRGHILEINAFGDLLPRVIWHGMDTYEAEIRAVIAHDPQERP